LWKAAIWFHFYGMDEVGEFDGILYEENRDVVADQVAFLRIKLDGKSAHVTWGIYRTRTSPNGRYPSKHGGLLSDLVQYFSAGIFFSTIRSGDRADCGPERVLIIGKRDALLRGERRVLSTSHLMQFAAAAVFLFGFSGIVLHYLFFIRVQWSLTPHY